MTPFQRFWQRNFVSRTEDGVLFWAPFGLAVFVFFMLVSAYFFPEVVI